MIKKPLGSAGRYFLNWASKPALVLLYHRVTNLKNDPQLLAVTPDNFYDHVSLLRKKFSLLEIEEFSELLISGKKMPVKPVILTFDDGYADNYHEALPILESLRTQALFYITTSNVNSDHEFWWDEIERIFLTDHQLPDFLEINVNDKLVRLRTSSVSERTNAYKALHPRLKYLAPEKRNALIAQIRQVAQINCNGRPTHRILSTEEIKLLSQSSSAIIGAHTHNHPALSVLSYKQQEEEIKLSKIILEKILAKAIDHFSYPYGSKKDYNQDSIQACQDIGFKMVCSNYHGHVRKWTDRFQVPRVLVRNWNKAYFEAYLTKTFKY